MSYLKPSGKELERFDGLSLIYWTLMGPYGIDRAVYCMEFTDCTGGLGIKVIGGLREFSSEEYGVYVKRILPGGVAYSDGRLQPGDQILEVNGESLVGVSNERAVDILRAASATSYMRLIIARDDEARKEFSELLEKCSSHSDTGSARSSPIMLGGRFLESTSSESSSCSQSPLLLSPASSQSQFLGVHSLTPHCSASRQDSCASDGPFIHPALRLSGGNPAASLQPRMMGNGLPACRLKVHVRSPECRHENNVPSPSPDICPPELTISAPVLSPNHRTPPSLRQKVTLDPHVRIREEKLEVMLQYLGLEASEDRRRELHRGLSSDCQGTVSYGDLVQALQDSLQDEMEEAGLDGDCLLFTHCQAASLLDTSAFHSKEVDGPRFSESLELEQLQDEVSELRQEVRRLKALLVEVETSKKVTEEELQRMNQKVLGLLSENRCLQNKLQAAEAAQRQAHSAEHDYEEVVHLLEAEISELKKQMSAKKVVTLEVNQGMDLNRRLSLSDCQLRKSEVTRKHLEVSNKRLFHFVQKIQKLLSSMQLNDEKRGEDDALKVCLPSAQTLATEAGDILESCTACPFSCGDFYKNSRAPLQPGPSSQSTGWSSPPCPVRSPRRQSLSRSEEVLYTAKGVKDHLK